MIRGARFQTNLADHVRVLESECMIEHAQGPVPGRHVNWVVESLRDRFGRDGIARLARLGFDLALAPGVQPFQRLRELGAALEASR